MSPFGVIPDNYLRDYKDRTRMEGRFGAAVYIEIGDYLTVSVCDYTTVF